MEQKVIAAYGAESANYSHALNMYNQRSENLIP